MRSYLFAFVALVSSLYVAAQSPTVVKKGKAVPASIDSTPLVLIESTVTRDWPKMLPVINLPPNLQDLSPGQCVRVAAISTGDGHEHLLNAAQLGFTVRFSAHTVELPLAPAATIKQVKLDGSDFVSAALAAGGVHYDLPTGGTIAASTSHWCVPAEAAAGTVEIRAVVSNGDKQKPLGPVTLPILSPEKPPVLPFTNKEGLEKWTMTYHEHPQAALLGVAIGYAVDNDILVPNIEEFFVSALRRDPQSAARLGPWLTAANRKTRIAALSLLAQAGVSLLAPPTLTDEDKQALAAVPKLPDPFIVSSDQEQFNKLDMLWANFMATGDRAPIEALIAMLAWQPDYEAFEKLRATHQKIEGLTPEIVRGVAYTAVGWALGSFQHSDTLAADYIEAIRNDPATPAAVKKELGVLDTDPAFQRTSGDSK